MILGHWGEVVLFYAERLAAMDRVSGLAHPIASYLRRNLYVTGSGMFSPDYLARAAAIVGTDRLLFSTDYPYQYRISGTHGASWQNVGWMARTGLLSLTRIGNG